MFEVRQFEARTLTWWYSHRHEIDMSPPYQRRSGIWTQYDEAYLIDSILNEFDFPKIYVADFTFGHSPLNEKKMRYAMIDGKQRFESIFRFIEGELVLNKDFVFLENPSMNLSGLGYKDLKMNYPHVAEIFDNYNPTVMRVLADDARMIADLFVRLNRNRALTGAELRNAMPGPIPPLLRELAAHKFFESRIKFTTKRGQDQNMAAKLLLLEYREKFVDVKKEQLDRFVREAAISDTTEEAFEPVVARTKSILDAMTSIFLPKDPLLSNQGGVPVYYWLVREAAEGERRLMRHFLTRFQSERYENRRIAADSNRGVEVDPELSRFDFLDRSTNDSWSLEGRYEILRKRLSGYQLNSSDTLTAASGRSS